jgi:hypothetical protein
MEDKLVRVIWCKCGGSVYYAGDPNSTSKETIKEINSAKADGCKIEIVTLDKFRELPFLTCKH